MEFILWQVTSRAHGLENLATKQSLTACVRAQATTSARSVKEYIMARASANTRRGVANYFKSQARKNYRAGYKAGRRSK